MHKWADLQRALLAEGQSVWCCKDCIGIINEDKDATYKEIRVKAEAAAAARLEPLPEITGLGDSQVARATDPSSIASTDAGGTDAGGEADAARAADEAQARVAPARVAPTGVRGATRATASAGAAGAAAAADQGASSAGDLEAKMLRLQAEMKAMKDEPATMSVKICSPCSLL